MANAEDAAAAPGTEATCELRPRRCPGRVSRPRNPSNVPHESDTELQATTLAVFWKHSIKTVQRAIETLRRVLSDKGLGVLAPKI